MTNYSYLKIDTALAMLKKGLLLLLCTGTFNGAFAQTPNIMVIIADDLGVDFSNGYHEGQLMPTTPTLDGLRANGITFENAFATSKCTPTRATIISGKYGNKTGVLGTPGHLSTSHTSIFRAIENQTNGLYKDAVIGKWHISSPPDPMHPHNHGLDFYSGVLGASVDDYFLWQRTENGTSFMDSTYVTTALTNTAIDWINAQEQPWFLWLAHVAPHGPFHTPPDSLYSINTTGNNRRKYIAMIEAMDHELGRLFNSIPEEELENTLIIYLGDNGTPNGVLQDYPNGHGKATLYQGGVRVPLIISGAGVTRQGVRESTLVHVTDIYATLLELVGADLAGGIHNSLSFLHLLNDTPGSTRDYNYTEQQENGINGYAIRNERYKLIEFLNDGSQEFYDLLLDSLETTNLLDIGLDANQQAIKDDLELEGQQKRSAWSCRDHIQNGDEDDIDCGGTDCANCITSTNELEEDQAVLLFPNPTQSTVVVEVPFGKYQGEVQDVKGRVKTAFTFDGNQTRLDLSELPKGVYFLCLHNAENQHIFIKRVIKH